MSQDRFNTSGFKCPHCRREAQQDWKMLYAYPVQAGFVKANWLDKELRWQTAQVTGQAQYLSPDYLACARDIIIKDRYTGPLDASSVDNLTLSICYSCKRVSVWHCDKLIIPERECNFEAHPDLPEYCKADFLEACAVAAALPRAAASLLRACMEKF